MEIPGIGKMMKKMQQMQDDMKKSEDELNELEITGEAGAGLVKITLNGRKECKKVDIDDSVFEDDKDMLEDLIAAAINDASHKADKEREDRMCGVTSGLNIPGGLNSLLK